MPQFKLNSHMLTEIEQTSALLIEFMSTYVEIPFSGFRGSKTLPHGDRWVGWLLGHQSHSWVCHLRATKLSGLYQIILVFDTDNPVSVIWIKKLNITVSTLFVTEKKWPGNELDIHCKCRPLQLISSIHVTCFVSFPPPSLVIHLCSADTVRLRCSGESVTLLQHTETNKAWLQNLETLATSWNIIQVFLYLHF